VDDSTKAKHTPLAVEWVSAKNRLYAKAHWISQVALHLGNHMRLAPIALSVWQLPSDKHFLFQLLHPFLSDLPFVNEVWGANLILDDFTTGFAPDDRQRSCSLLRAASGYTTKDARTMIETYTPCHTRDDTHRVYSRIVHECLRTFVEHVVETRNIPEDPVAIAFLQDIRRRRSLPPSLDQEAFIEDLTWVLHEASFIHSIYHIAPQKTLMEQWGHRVSFGHPLERDRMDIVSVALTLPESMCSLYPLHLDTLGTFQLGTSVDVLRDVIRCKLEPYIRDVLKAPGAIICTHGH
jgi:hypothetical protein